MKKLSSNNKGFSLVEGIVVLILSGLIIATLTGVYVQYLKVSKRQQRFIQIERELFSVQRSLAQAVTTLPGRGLATTNGLAFGTPVLPVAGSIQNPAGGLSPIKLGIITPYKINGQDAFTVAYADVKIPRLPVSEDVKIEGSIGRARVSFIATQSNFIVTKGGSTVSGLASGSVGSSSGTGKSTTEEFSLAGDVKGTPTPSPSPSSSPVPSPSPSPTGDSTPSPTSTPIPPNIPYNETLLNLPWKATPDMFKPGDVLLLVSVPNIPKSIPGQEQQQVKTGSRIVKILSSIGTTNSKGELQAIDFTFDLCTSGECGGQLPGLTNPPDAETKFLAGSILVPLKLATFYYKSDQMSNRLVRNDGGVVLPVGDNNFRVQGGIDDIVGETDTFTVSYHLKDGTVQPTPNTPVVPWLNDVTSVDVEMFREMPVPQGNERISRKAKLNFPITIRNLN